MDLDKQIRISPGSHAALKKFSSENGMTMRDAVALAVKALSPTIVVAVKDGAERIVEAYVNGADAGSRMTELGQSGFLCRNVRGYPQEAWGSLYDLRPYGPEWKRATGWTLPDTSRRTRVEQQVEALGDIDMKDFRDLVEAKETECFHLWRGIEKKPDTKESRDAFDIFWAGHEPTEQVENSRARDEVLVSPDVGSELDMNTWLPALTPSSLADFMRWCQHDGMPKTLDSWKAFHLWWTP